MTFSIFEFSQKHPKRLRIFLLILLLILAYIPLFHKLSHLPIRIFDEGRLAINAFEMSKNGNLITTFYHGNPDMWNTKPPLLIWIQAIDFKIFGINELAMRLPIAFSALALVLFIYYFLGKFGKSMFAGFFASLVLISTYGFVNIHASRTGDYDVLVTLFMITSAFSFFVFLETGRAKFLYIFFLLLSLGVLTKSITALMFLPAIFLYSVFDKKVFITLQNRNFYFGVFIFLVPIISYYLARELQNPGYFKAVIENEITGRYMKTLEYHEEKFSFYFEMMRKLYFKEWFYVAIGSLVFANLNKSKVLRKLNLYILLIVVEFFLVISFAKTKLEWYTVPIYPLLATSIGIGFLTLIQFVEKHFTRNNEFLKYGIAIFLSIILLFEPFRKSFDRWYNPREHDWDFPNYELCYHLKDALKGNVNVSGYNVVYNKYLPNIEFYVNALNEHNVQTKIKKVNDIIVGDKIITPDDDVKSYIEDHFNYSKSIIGNINKYEILSAK